MLICQNMRHGTSTLHLNLALCFAAGTVAAQTPVETPPSAVVGKSITAIGYQVGRGATRISLKGTELVPQAGGEAKIEAKKGITTIQIVVSGLVQPTRLGTEFLTYVLWTTSPEGRAGNLGELIIDKSGQGKLSATTQYQTFSVFVTAEPYFSVHQPSEMVVLENEISPDTKGKVFTIEDYKLMRRSQYQQMQNPLALAPDLKNVPLEIYEARNAVQIAQSRGARKYAADILDKAQASLKQAEDALARKANRKEIVSTARETVQFAEDARALSVEQQEKERVAQEREAAAAKAKAEAEAKAQAEAAAAKAKADAEAEAARRKAEAEAAEAKRKADEEARQQAELAAAREAQMKAEAAEARRRAEEDARHQAELAAAREAQMKAEADAAAAKAKAEADILAAREEAAKADAERSRKAAEELRAQLLEQFNRILETRDSPRGLVVNMADVLFDTGKYNLRPATREKLARLSGIVLAHPGLNLAIEGHTDSTGSDELNQKLSEQRAEVVRSYLIEQGLGESSVTAQGFGKTMPVADNATAAGRQKNRRVEIIVSGEVIGAKIGK